MRLVKNTIESDIVGKPLLTFNKELTKEAIATLGTKIEFMEAIYLQVDQLLSDGHIRSVLDNLEALQTVFETYKTTSFERRRNATKLRPTKAVQGVAAKR